jgi:phosphatidylserine/phosphatidylglycerophosphate/cardiolipin synthase-like enzyme
VFGVRILTDRVLKAFAELVHAYSDRVYRVWVITPWLSSEEDDEDALLLLLDSMRKSRGCSVVVVTRPPATDQHLAAIRVIRRHASATIYLCASLHTKLYIAECDGFRAAVLGSPNFTTRGDRVNRELAVEFRTTAENTRVDPTAALVSELIDYASSIRNDEDVTLYRGDR